MDGILRFAQDDGLHSSDGGPSRSINPGGMTRIGFAYNQKPACDESQPSERSLPRAERGDKPPSTRRDIESRNFASSVPATVGARSLTASTQDDRFAEWDGPETID